MPKLDQPALSPFRFGQLYLVDDEYTTACLWECQTDDMWESRVIYSSCIAGKQQDLNLNHAKLILGAVAKLWESLWVKPSSGISDHDRLLSDSWNILPKNWTNLGLENTTILRGYLYKPRQRVVTSVDVTINGAFDSLHSNVDHIGSLQWDHNMRCVWRHYCPGKIEWPWLVSNNSHKGPIGTYTWCRGKRPTCVPLPLSVSKPRPLPGKQPSANMSSQPSCLMAYVRPGEERRATHWH